MLHISGCRSPTLVPVTRRPCSAARTAGHVRAVLAAEQQANGCFREGPCSMLLGVVMRRPKRLLAGCFRSALQHLKSCRSSCAGSTSRSSCCEWSTSSVRCDWTWKLLKLRSEGLCLS